MSKQLTIELTEQQEIFLKEFASKHYDGAEDNLFTSDAFHVVQTKRYNYIPYSDDLVDYYNPDKLVFTMDDEYDTWFSDETELIRSYYKEWKMQDCPIDIKPFGDVIYEQMETVDDEEEYISSYDDYFAAYGVSIRGIAWEEEYWDDIAFFFIRDEAKRYMEYQKHNLHKPRVYTYSAGYANYGDFVPFRNLLLSMGEKLNKKVHITE